jgi:hypothetical protein
MLYQLASGRTIEISMEQYLDMTDEELQDLECLGNMNTMEINNPWHAKYSKGDRARYKELTDEHNLIDLPTEVKLADKYFQKPDDE